MILEQRLMSERSLAIRPTLQFHLDDSEVNPKLQLFTSIVPHDLTRFYLPGFMRPPVQQVVQVQIAHSHEISKEVGKCQKARRDLGAGVARLPKDPGLLAEINLFRRQKTVLDRR